MGLAALDERGWREEDFDAVRLQVRGEPWGVLIDVQLTPLYCMNCEAQLPHLYYHGGSRYGHVGEVQCDRCGARINCVDGDTFVEFMDTYCYCTARAGEEPIPLRIDYYALYRLQKPVWDGIRAKTGFDIVARYKGSTVPLGRVVEEIIGSIDSGTTLPREESLPDGLMKRLPAVVMRWISLLNHLGIHQP